jgi:hypothetical protein
LAFKFSSSKGRLICEVNFAAGGNFFIHNHHNDLPTSLFLPDTSGQAAQRFCSKFQEFSPVAVKKAKINLCKSFPVENMKMATCL